MNNINLNDLENVLLESFGINIVTSAGDSFIDVRPDDLQPGTGFTVRISIGWRSLTAEFVPDNFSGSLIRAMGAADQQKRMLFRSIASAIRFGNEELVLRVNGFGTSPLDIESWPLEWHELYIRISRIPVMIDELSVDETQELIERIALEAFGLIVPLLPLEESFNEVLAVGLPEGAVSRVEVNRYERSAINREACILVHGCICKVCGFDFEKCYGKLGRGYIHVHHVTPVSQLGPGYKVDPTTDLVPVCPNCHAMLHKINPPLNVDQLRNIILEGNKVGWPLM